MQIHNFVGDRATVDVDQEERLMLLRRVNSISTSKGFALSGQKKDIGKSGIATIRLTHQHILPTPTESTDCENVRVTDEGILFEVPAHCWSSHIEQKKEPEVQ